MTKNIGKSIKTRLLNLAKEEKQDYMKVLVRYTDKSIFDEKIIITSAVPASVSR